MEGVISLLSSGQQGQQLTEADLSLRRQHAESVMPHSLRWECHSTPQRASSASLGPAPITPRAALRTLEARQCRPSPNGRPGHGQLPRLNRRGVSKG